MYRKALALLALLALTGCGTAASGGSGIQVDMTDFKLTPETVSVKAGETVTFTLHNKSGQDHEFESDEGKFEEVVVPPGKSRTVTWQAPQKMGEYIFECDMAGHEGMEMKVTVTE